MRKCTIENVQELHRHARTPDERAAVHMLSLWYCEMYLQIMSDSLAKREPAAGENVWGYCVMLLWSAGTALASERALRQLLPTIRSTAAKPIDPQSQHALKQVAHELETSGPSEPHVHILACYFVALFEANWDRTVAAQQGTFDRRLKGPDLCAAAVEWASRCRFDRDGGKVTVEWPHFVVPDLVENPPA